MSTGNVSELCMLVVKICLMLFGVVGVFGNFNIILATATNARLRSKCGVLLSILALCDLWSLLFEMLSGFRLWTNTATMSRKSCFWSIIFYLFVENVECYMIFAIGVDRLIAISSPIRYQLIEKSYYIPILTLPGVFYSLVIVALGIVNLDEATVTVCNPPLAYSGYVTSVWNISGMVICVATLLVYFTTYVMLYKIAPKFTGLNALNPAQLDRQKAMVKTLTVNVVAFTCSALLSALIICIMDAIKVNKDTLADAVTYAVIPGLLSYSINYYVYFWRSSEYRKAFLKQLPCGSLSRMVNRGGNVVRTSNDVLVATNVRRLSISLWRVP